VNKKNKELIKIITQFEKNAKNLKRLTLVNGPLNCQKFDKKIFKDKIVIHTNRIYPNDYE